MSTVSENGIIIVGASARAAAWSALRAGLTPWCVDLFADLDLQSIAPVAKIDTSSYPHGFCRIVRDESPHYPLIYTGGLENHPAVYLELASYRKVLSYLHPDPFTGMSVRNPWMLQRWAQDIGVACPRIESDAGHLPVHGFWLCKALASSGGQKIQRWLGQPLAAAKHYYFQEFTPGIPWSATYIAQAHDTTCLGVTRQLIGEAFLHAPTPFTYCGNIGPLEAGLSTAEQQKLDMIGQHFASRDDYLRGIFGIDFICNNREMTILEVNPRYPASLEVLELASGRSGLEWIKPRSKRVPMVSGPSHLGKLGKAIYYSPCALTFPQDGPWSDGTPPDLWQIPQFADIPHPGSRIEAGHPVITFFAQGIEESDVLAGLQHKAACLDKIFLK